MKFLVSFGCTGAGKSFIGNKLSGSTTLKESGFISSATTDCTAVHFQLGGDDVKYVDTPGTLDSGTDPLPVLAQWAKFHDKCRMGEGKCRMGVDFFLYVINGRFNDSDHKTLGWLHKMYGSDIFSNMFLVFNQTEKHTSSMMQQLALDAAQDATRSANVRYWLAECGERFYCVRRDFIEDDLTALKSGLSSHNNPRFNPEVLACVSEQLINLADIMQGLEKQVQNAKEQHQMQEHLCRQHQRASGKFDLWKANKCELKEVLEACSSLSFLASLQTIVQQQHRPWTLLFWFPVAVLLPLLLPLLHELQMSGTGVEVWWEDFYGSIQAVGQFYPEGPSEGQQYCARLLLVLFTSIIASCFGQKDFNSHGWIQGLWLGLEVSGVGLCCSSVLSCALGEAKEDQMAWISSALLVAVMIGIKVYQVAHRGFAGVAREVKKERGPGGWYLFMLLFPSCAIFCLDRQLGNSLVEETTVAPGRDTSETVVQPVLLPQVVEMFPDLEAAESVPAPPLAAPEQSLADVMGMGTQEKDWDTSKTIAHPSPTDTACTNSRRPSSASTSCTSFELGEVKLNLLKAAAPPQMIGHASDCSEDHPSLASPDDNLEKTD